MDLGLDNATVVVQGGPKAWASCGECFAVEGAAVLAANEADLDATCAHLRALGSPDTIALQADITDLEQVEAAFREVADRWGELNILVNAPVRRAPSLRRPQRCRLGRHDRDRHDGMVRCVRAAALLRAAEWRS
jgi:NAD(P)-dependent dehydrogenase (short-subunit alcohol dehydrogenase family)